MKQLITSLLLLTAGFPGTRPSPSPEVYVASTPCDGIPRSLLSIPAATECELIKWTLTLHRDVRTQTPTVYTLHYTFGMSKLGTVDLKGGGAQVQKEGKWDIVKEATGRTIYRLILDTPEKPLSFIRLDNNLLHLLDPQGKLMIGNAAWSYTLNRKHS